MFLKQNNQEQNKKDQRPFDLDELERARSELEQIVGGISTLAATAKTSQARVSVGGRKRRLVEIGLIQSLVSSDDAIDELMSLWIRAECPTAVHSIDAIIFLEKECSSLQDAEDTLHQIIKEFPVWPEPQSRLALLLFVQGKLKESQNWVDSVLELKPWNFETQHLQLLLHLVNQDFTGALRSARKGLPPLDQPRKRAMWVQQAVQQAATQLAHLEKRHSEEELANFDKTDSWQ